MPDFMVGNRPVGKGHPPLVVAEIGINHEGDLTTAIHMATAAIQAGAEVIKHQTHVIEDEMSVEARSVIPGNAETSIYEIIERCALSEDDEFQLMEFVKSRGCIFISTPFSRAAVERLSRFDIPAVKIGSGECNNLPLIKEVVKLAKPVILSTGMNSIASIRPAVEIFRAANLPFALLHCTNIYPTPPELVRLGAIQQLSDAFPEAVIGLSDHSCDNYSSFGAVALGAQIIEKHFTDSYDRPGPDISSSMDPARLADLIAGVRTIWLARGGVKEALKEEAETMAFAFASVVALTNIRAGDTLTRDNVWVMRPSGGGYPANDYERIIGGKILIDVNAGYQLPANSVAFAKRSG
jgi:N-acetylneuraminate synthase